MLIKLPPALVAAATLSIISYGFSGSSSPAMTRSFEKKLSIDFSEVQESISTGSDLFLECTIAALGRGEFCSLRDSSESDLL